MKPLWWRHGTIIAFLDALIPSSIWTCPDISHAQDTMLAAAAAAAERKTQAPKPPEDEAAMEAHEEALAEDDLMLAEGEEEDVIEDDRIVDLREWIFMFLIGAAVAQGALRENIVASGFLCCCVLGCHLSQMLCWLQCRFKKFDHHDSMR